MGEIKSTLDLVMERTRHLSLSDEEKTQHKKTDFDKRLQGLLQQYADGALDRNAVQEKIAELQHAMGVDDRRRLAAALAGRIDPDGDNDRWLDLLAGYLPGAEPRLRDLLERHHSERERFEADTRSQLRAALADRGISGSAVRPIPHRDAAFTQRLNALRQQTLARIHDAVNAATDAP